ncbi:tetratricopeptide repeat protein [Persephonella sp.]
MSLIVDMLKKLKTKRGNHPVPPNLKVEKRNNKKLIILSTVVIVLVIFGIGGYYYLENMPQSNLLYSQENLREQPEPDIRHPVAQQKERKQEETIEDKKEDIVGELDIIPPVSVKTEKKELPPLDKVLAKIENTEDEKESKDQPDTTDTMETQTPTKFSAYLSLAEKYLDEGNLEKSLEYYKKAYSINPSEDILNNILVLLVDTGNIKNINKYLQKTKNTEIISSVIIRLIDSERFYLAKDLIDKYIGSDPRGVISYTYGYYLETTGNISEAAFYYEKAYSRNPSDPYFAYSYGRILEIKGNYKKAYKIYKKILNLNCNDESLLDIVKSRLYLLEANEDLL